MSTWKWPRQCCLSPSKLTLPGPPAPSLARALNPWKMGISVLFLLSLRKVTLSLVAQTVKNPSAMQETQDRSLGWEDPLEKGMATHSSVLAWRIPWTEEPGGPQSMVFRRVGHDGATKAFAHSLTCPHPRCISNPDQFYTGNTLWKL